MSVYLKYMLPASPTNSFYFITRHEQQRLNKYDSLYHNYKGMFSYVVMAVVDDNYRFIYNMCVMPSSHLQ